MKEDTVNMNTIEEILDYAISHDAPTSLRLSIRVPGIFFVWGDDISGHYSTDGL